ncbi:HdeD family acid-resistance protein [Lutibacter sp.]
MELTNKIKHWWIPVLLGALLVTGSFYIASQPVATFITLTLFFGWLIAFNGVSNIVFAVRNRNFFNDWKLNLMFAILETVLGVVLILQPHLSAETLMFFTGFWLMFNAISKIIFSWMLKKMTIKEWWLILISGVIMLIFSILIIINPVFAIASIVYLVSIPMGILGIIAILFGFQIRKFNNN